MKRSLVKGRNGGKQRHSCVACGKCDHRLKTCTSRAAKEIRKLKRQLADACSRQTGCAKKKHVCRTGPLSALDKKSQIKRNMCIEEVPLAL